jgi:hypothetical protein
MFSWLSKRREVIDAKGLSCDDSTHELQGHVVRWGGVWGGDLGRAWSSLHQSTASEWKDASPGTPLESEPPCMEVRRSHTMLSRAQVVAGPGRNKAEEARHLCHSHVPSQMTALLQN